jgi:hypothetical protein
MTGRARLGLRLIGVALLAAGIALYLVRAGAVRRDLREGRAAYEAVCARVTESARVSGSPGSIAHLVSALQVELTRLAEQYPRWYERYRKDPSAYPCGPQVPYTQVGSDR